MIGAGHGGASPMAGEPGSSPGDHQPHEKPHSRPSPTDSATASRRASCPQYDDHDRRAHREANDRPQRTARSQGVGREPHPHRRQAALGPVVGEGDGIQAEHAGHARPRRRREPHRSADRRPRTATRLSGSCKIAWRQARPLVTARRA
jgi:hypothetical protein